MKNIIVLIVISYLFSSCQRKDKVNNSISTKRTFNLEKIVVINNNENSTVYFKVKITNTSDSSLVFIDNSLVGMLENNLIKKGKDFI